MRKHQVRDRMVSRDVHSSSVSTAYCVNERLSCACSFSVHCMMRGWAIEGGAGALQVIGPNRHAGVLGAAAWSDCSGCQAAAAQLITGASAS